MKKRMISVLLVLTLVLSLFSGVGKAEAAYDKVYTYYDGEKLVTVSLDTTSKGASVKGTPYGYESRGVEITLTDKDQIFAYSGASMDTHMGYYWSGASSASLWGEELNQGITDDVLKKFLDVGKNKGRDKQLELLEMVYKGLDIRGDWYVAVDKQAHYWVFKYPAYSGMYSNQYVIFNSDEMTEKELARAFDEMNMRVGNQTMTIWSEELLRGLSGVRSWGVPTFTWQQRDLCISCHKSHEMI